MDIQLLKDYAEIKRQKASLEEQESILKIAVIAELEKYGKTKEDTVFGKFSIATRKNYKYSEKIELLEERVELAKIKEREKGVAEITETSYLLYKQA